MTRILKYLVNLKVTLKPTTESVLLNVKEGSLRAAFHNDTSSNPDAQDYLNSTKGRVLCSENFQECKRFTGTHINTCVKSVNIQAMLAYYRHFLIITFHYQLF